MCRVPLAPAPRGVSQKNTPHYWRGGTHTLVRRPRATQRNQEDSDPRRPSIPRHALSRRPTAGSEGDEALAAASCFAVGDCRFVEVSEEAEGIGISRMSIAIRNVKLWTNGPMRCNDFRAALHITELST